MLMPQILVLLLAATDSRAGDPYRSMAKAVAKEARARRFESVAVQPFKAFDPQDDLAGRVVAERLIAALAGSEGLSVTAGGETPVAKPPPNPGALEPVVFEGVLRQFQIQDLEMQDTPYERERRAQLREALKKHQVDAARAAREAEQGSTRASGAILTGVLVPLKDGTLEVHVRMSDGGGGSFAAASARLSKDWGAAPKRGMGVPAAGGAAGAAAAVVWLLTRLSRA